MKWSDIPMNPSGKVLRQFAGAWLVLFSALAAHQGLANGRPQLARAIALLAVAVGIPGLAKPALIRWLFVGWMILAFPIGWVISQVVLVVLFFAILTPVALFFKLTGRDLLCRKPAPDISSYWTPKESPSEMGRYFRQY